MRKILLVPGVLMVGLATIGAVATNTMTFPDFADVSSLTLNGSAAQAMTADGDVLRLTPAQASQGGSAFLNDPLTLGDTPVFSTNFCFRLTGGADGMTFVLHNDPAGASALGDIGGNLGLFGITQSLAIEFDLFTNGGFGDPNNNHIGVDINGNPASQSTADATSVTVLGAGGLSCAWIDYDAATQTLEVRLATSTTRPASPLLTDTVDLRSLLGGGRAFAGFTAATGAVSASHDILDWTFTSQVQSIPTLGGYGLGALVLLLLAASVWLLRRSS